LAEAEAAEKDAKEAKEESLLAQAEVKTMAEKLRQVEEESRSLQSECKFELDRKREIEEAKNVIVELFKVRPIKNKRGQNFFTHGLIPK
jgi:hypothetical protein